MATLSIPGILNTPRIKIEPQKLSSPEQMKHEANSPSVILNLHPYRCELGGIFRIWELFWTVHLQEPNVTASLASGTDDFSLAAWTSSCWLFSSVNSASSICFWLVCMYNVIYEALIFMIHRLWSWCCLVFTMDFMSIARLYVVCGIPNVE